MQPTAIVMNMFYTGLGIARSLGKRGIPVIGLSAQRGIYGNFTRYAKIVSSPDSRRNPEQLADFLLTFGRQLDQPAIIFPTRDDDLLFLDRFREELSPNFKLAIPEHMVLHACLNKWETYQWTQRMDVPGPSTWFIESPENLRRILDSVKYPCVLKPVSAHQWRQGDNWSIVGARKAIGISSPQELLAEYAHIARAGKSALVQEMIPGPDNALVIVACYLDSQSRWVAGFNTQKVVQVPEGFGTGCIVQAADYPELTAPTARLLGAMRFTGTAEVEYKWDSASGTYKLIEINPRFWDQHRLSDGCGIDLPYLAYAEHAGLPLPVLQPRTSTVKWIAEDTFITTALTMLWKRDPKLKSLFRSARGNRIYAIWSASDPLPSLLYFTVRFAPGIFASGMRAAWRRLIAYLRGNAADGKELLYARRYQK